MNDQNLKNPGFPEPSSSSSGYHNEPSASTKPLKSNEMIGSILENNMIKSINENSNNIHNQQLILKLYNTYSTGNRMKRNVWKNIIEKYNENAHRKETNLQTCSVG